MKVVFDLCLDGPAHPGSLNGSSVAYGQIWVGPLGFLGLLETSFGLGGAFCDSSDRAASLAVSLKGRSGSAAGFWNASFKVDPIATAERLLRDRDLLALWGWQGQAASARLGQLADATADAQPGLPDRLRAVLMALKQNRPAMASVTSFTRPEHLPPLWARIFSQLEAQGVVVTWPQLAPASAKGDLAAARQADFVPRV